MRKKLSLKKGLQYHYEALRKQGHQPTDVTALLDQNWEEMNFKEGMKYENKIRESQGLEPITDVWDGKHDHLAALSLTREKVKAPRHQYETLTVREQRERLLRVFNYARRIKKPWLRKRAIAKIFCKNLSKEA